MFIRLYGTTLSVLTNRGETPVKNPKFFPRDLLAGERTLLVFASIVGLCAGFGSWGFTWLIDFFRGIFMQGKPLSDLFEKHWYLLPLSPMLGGLLVAPLSHLFPTEAKGHGVPEVMAAVALKNGILRPRTILLRAIASAITIGSGGSAGREGPIVQIGSAIGSSMGQAFKLHGDKIKILLGCGAAGGIAATFNAPLAGMVFSMEIILGDFTASTVTPIIISSVIATAVSQFLNGNMPVFMVPEYHIANYLELFFYGALGAVCGLCALLYVKTLYWCEDFFEKKVKAPNILKPALGGLILGLMALFLPNHEIMGNGYPTISQALNGNIVWQLALLLVFLKILGTSVTLGSGGSGGIFAPALFIGAMAGLSFGSLAHSLFPDMTAGPGAYALVGMGAVVAAATHAPLTSIFILFELTNKYEIILPIMISCIIATAVAKGLHPDSIYTLKLSRRGIKLHRGREESILASVPVKDVMSHGLESIPENTPFRDIISIISRSRNSYFPIVDGNGDMTGILSFSDIREVAFEEGLADLVVAKDVATANVISVTPGMNLNDAMEKFFSIDVAQLPVVDEKSPRRAIGILTRGDIIAAYNRRVLMRGMGK
jgi:CIC family chloride channel protein